MRLALAVQVALSIGVLSCSSSAFVPQSIPRTFGSNTRIQVGSWENDDFLDALSGGSKAQDKANEDYQEQSKFKPGEEPPSASDTSDESSQGGTRLQQLMAQAKNADSTPQGPRPQPITYKPPVYNPPNAAQEPPAAAPTQPGMPSSLDNLSVEEQAELFRKFMAGGQQLPQPVEAPAPSSAPVMRGGVDKQGRKIGRNKDSDTIANSSDLYFAQLKADSTIRTLARYSGDDETAKNVMGHEAIKEIEDSVQVNPYLEAQKEEERKMLETSEDELLSMMQFQTERPQHEASYSGISFRDKMRQAKEKKAGGATAASPTAQSTPATAEPKVEPAPVVPPPAVAAVVTPPAPVIPPPVAAVVPPPAPVIPPPVAAVVPPPAPVIPPPVVAAVPPPAPAVVATPPPAPVVAAPEPASTTSLADADAETKRRSIRTLMGLMLKHRGGPGFGAGRLKEPEALKLENLLGDVIGMLRTEIGTESPPAPTNDAAPAVSAAPAQATAPAAAGFDFDRLTGTIACIDGAVDMYKKSAAEEKSENLLALRSALMAAVNSCNAVIAEAELAAASTPAAPPATAPAAPTGMGFPDTFAVTKPEAPAASTGMGFPDSYAVTKPDAPAIGPDANTAVLEDIYEKLKAASGDGKLGLKSDLTSAEADVLVDELVSMRDVLMEELDSGIPGASPAQPQQAASADPAPPAEVDTSADAGVDPYLSNSKSKYAQMLAKAQAKKKNGQ